MEAEEKEKQILEASKTTAVEGLTPEQEADIFFPEADEVKIKGRSYRIESLKLYQMKLLLRLSKINLGVISEDSIDKVVEGFSELLGEPDKAFLEKNLDIGLIRDIVLKIRSKTYAGIPAQKGGPKGQRTTGDI